MGNARATAGFLCSAFGFHVSAYAGPETGIRDRASYLLEQGSIRLVVTAGLTAESPISNHVSGHGDGVHDIAFLVEDADHAFHEAVRRGATPVEEPHDHGDENGVVRHASIATYGDTIHSFLSYDRVSSPHVSKGNGTQK